MRKKDAEKARRRKIRRAVIIEIVFMALGVVCCLLPLPWRLGALIVLGAREIVLKGIRAAKEPPAPAVVHCCGGDKPKTSKRKTSKADNQTEAPEEPKKRKVK